MWLTGRPARLSGAVLLSAVCTTGIVAVSFHSVPPPGRVALRTGTAWVTSDVVGEVTLLDGVGGELAARIPVAEPGDHLAMVQSGADAYALDQDDGKATRVDGATLRPMPSIEMLRERSGTDQVVVAGDTFYAVNRADGGFVRAQARTMTAHGAPGTVAVTSQIISTGDGFAWVLDPSTGTVRRYGPDVPRTRFRPRSSGAGNLVDVGGNVVTLDRHTGHATLIDKQTGDPTGTLDAELAEGDVASGSEGSPHLLVVRPEHGSVAYCRFGEGSCRSDIYLTAGADQLGPAVEVADHVMVPDYSTGLVHIVDLARDADVAQARLFDPDRLPRTFELTARDGIVFFNDPASERAGIVRTDGHVVHIAKYDPVAPRSVITANPSPTGRPTPTRKPTPDVRPSGAPSHTTVPRRATTGAPVSGSGPPSNGLSVTRLDINPPVPQVGEPVSISAVTAGVAPTEWQWSVTRADGSVVARSSQARFSVTFTTVGVYDVTVTASRGATTATRRDRLTVVAVAPPLRCGDTVTGVVQLRVDLVCPGDGLIVGGDNVTIDLAGHTITGPSNGTGKGISNSGTGDLSNLTIRNGMVQHFADGVQAAGFQGVDIDNMKFRDNVGTGGTGVFGDIRLSGVTGCTIEGGVLASGSVLTAEAAFNTLISGVTIEGTVTFADSAQDTVENSSIVDGGIDTSQASAITIENNDFSHSAVALFESDDDTIRDNTFHNSRIVAEDETKRLQIINNRLAGGGIAIGMLQTYDLTGSKISGNTVSGAPAAGIYINEGGSSGAQPFEVSHNTLTGNGHNPGGLTDANGSLVDDGLHVTVAPGTGVTIVDNRTSGNADYGIEAVPGSVAIDGGNVADEPHGCVGVSCA